MTDRPYQRKTQANRRQPQRAGGFSLIELLIVVAIIGIIAALSIPNLLASRRAANEASAISAIRTISSAQESYRATKGGGSGFTDLDGLVEAKMVDSSLGTATTADRAKSGYIFAVTTSDSDTAFCAGAAPTTLNNGSRNFSSDTPGVLYEHPVALGTPPTSTAGGVPLRN
jgi:type IV pilus assembly protein PilA